MNIQLPETVYHLLNTIARVNYIRNHDVFEKYGLHPGQPRLLIALSQEDGQSQAQLCESLQLRASTVTVMISRMIKNDLIEKNSDPHDKRICRIYLTDKGRMLCGELKKIHDESNTVCTKHMSVEEHIILRRLLMQVLDNLNEELSHKGGDFPC